MSMLIVLVAIRSVKRYVLGLGTAFLAIGASILAAYGMPWTSFVGGFGKMLNILSLFALIPLISIPIGLGRYAAEVQAMIGKHVRTSGLLYAITSFLSYILSSFLNLATLPMMYHMIRPSLDLYPIAHKERFISRAITHGYSMPILWTPVAPIVGIVVEMTGVQWSSILPIVIPFSLLALVADWMMGLWIANRRKRSIGQMAAEEAAIARQQAADAMDPASDKKKASHPGQIFAAILLFNLMIFVLERYTHFGFLLLVSLSVIPFAFLWSVLLGKGREFVSIGRKALPEHLLKMQDQFFIFLSAGFMISAIQTTGASHMINTWIGGVENVIGTDMFLLIIPLIPLLLAFIGLHPAVALALTAESLKPAALGISADVMAIAMLTGAATAFLMGPYNATAGLMSSLAGVNSYRVSNWNAPFTAIYLVMVMLLLIILKASG